MLNATKVILKQTSQVKSRTHPVRLGSNLTGFSIGDNMKKIPLTQGRFALVDDEDFDRINQFKWNLYDNGKFTYAVTNHSLRMHRVVMHAPKDKEVDHRNHNGLDNQKHNLRVCTKNENQHNRRLNANNASGYKGVCWHKRINKWQSYIRFQSKRIFLGYFADKVEAAKAYDKKAEELFGEFACLNFPKENYE